MEFSKQKSVLSFDLDDSLYIYLHDLKEYYDFGPRWYI